MEWAAALREDDVAFFVNAKTLTVYQAFVLIRRADQLSDSVFHLEFGKNRIADSVNRVEKAHGKQQLFLYIDTVFIDFDFEIKIVATLIRARSGIHHVYRDWVGGLIQYRQRWDTELAFFLREQGDDIVSPRLGYAINAAYLTRGARAENVEILSQWSEI